jgi:hypothetical protein
LLRFFSNAQAFLSSPWMGVKASSDRPATIGSGVADAARIQAAYQTMADAKVPITPGQARNQSPHRLPHRLALA